MAAAEIPRISGRRELAGRGGVSGRGALDGCACPSVRGAGTENICVYSPGPRGVAGAGGVGTGGGTLGVAKVWVAPVESTPDGAGVIGWALGGGAGTSRVPNTRVNSPTRSPGEDDCGVSGCCIAGVAGSGSDAGRWKNRVNSPVPGLAGSAPGLGAGAWSI